MKQFSIIAALAKNRVIGHNNDLIWHISADLKRFKEITSGHCVITGRKNFIAMGRPLPNRTNIVMTRDYGFMADAVLVAHSLDAIPQLVKEDDEPFVIGGGEIYRLFLDAGWVNKMYLTWVDEAFDGDTCFPDYDTSEWTITNESDWLMDETSRLRFRYCDLKKSKTNK